MSLNETSLCYQNTEGFFGIDAHGKHVFEHYPWVEHFLDQLGKPGFLARGREQADGRILWFTQLEGPVHTFDQLSTQDKQLIRRDINDTVKGIRGIIDQLRNSDDKDSRERADILAEIIGPPDDSYVFMVGDRPVIAGWGLRVEKSTPSESLAVFVIDDGRVSKSPVPEGQKEAELDEKPIPLKKSGQTNTDERSKIHESTLIDDHEGKEQKKIGIIEKKDKEPRKIRWWLWLLMALALVILLLFLLRSCNMLPAVITHPLPKDVILETPTGEHSPIKIVRPHTRIEDLPVPPSSGLSDPKINPNPKSDIPVGSEPPTPTITERIPTPISDEPSHGRLITIKEKDVRGVKELSILPPDQQAVWRIEFDTQKASEEVMRNPGGYLWFEGSSIWDQAKGSAVLVGYAAPQDGSQFTARVVASPPGKEVVIYLFRVGGK